jgi:putrescine---pyruvate transaminase
VNRDPDADSAPMTLWHGQAHMPTVKRAQTVIERGEGAYLFTEDGRRLLDLPASLWYCNVGHGRREIADAVADQMGRIEAYSNFQQYATRPAIELAARLAALAPVPDGRVFLTSGGSDAVEVAAKLARRYWTAEGRPEKRIIVSRTRCYHGLHGFGTSVTGLGPNREGYGELMPDTLRVAHDDWHDLEAAVAEHGAGRIAAFFCEPVIGTGGILPPNGDYLEQVQRICRENDILLVVDEVITGFGRTGRLFASERYGLTPDILLFAKGVTSGYLPLGGAIVSGRVAEPFWADGSDLVFRHGLTYQGHASVCAAAHANLDIIEREDLVARAAALEGPLERVLRPLAEHPEVVEVRTVGMLGAIQVRDATLAAAAVAHCLEHGILTRAIGDGDTLHVCPPFVVTEDELAGAAEVIGAALDAASASLVAGGAR